MNSNSILKPKESAERVSWSALEATAKDAAEGVTGRQTNPPSFYMLDTRTAVATDPAGASSASAEAEHWVPTGTPGADQISSLPKAKPGNETITREGTNEWRSS